MVVGAFPAAKLGALLLKQISKPIANAVKEQAKSSPVFRKYVCMPPAQFYNWCEVKAKMWILNLGKPVNIPVLSEAMAIELGANLLGEGIIFIIAAGVLIAEYTRSARKEALKEEAKKQEMSEIQNAIRELFIQSEEQGAHIRELMRTLGELDTRIGQTQLNSDPTPPKSTPEKPPADVPSFDAPQPPSNNLVQSTVRYTDPTSYKRNNSSNVHNSLILKAVNDVENQFWNSPLIERQTSTLILAVYHVNRLFRFQQ